MSGSGGSGGYEYQHNAVGYIAAHILAGEPLIWLETGAPDIPIAVAAETGGPGDDLCITLQNGVIVELQAKHGLQKGKLFEPLLKLAKGLHENSSLYGVLLTDSTASRTIRDYLRNDLIKLGQSCLDSLRPITKEFQDQLANANLPKDSSDIFRRLRIIVLDLDDDLPSAKSAQTLLSKLISDQHQTSTAWKILCDEGQSLTSNPGRRDREGWYSLLNNHSILMGEKPSYKDPEQKINWQETCQVLLEQWKGLTTNALTKPDGVRFQLDDVFVPLGVVERRQKPRHAHSEGSPEQGSELYEEKVTPISHNSFFENVLRQGQSPYSQGKRIAIIGEPGAGKTTQLQKIGDWILQETDGIPIWIPLSAVGEKGLRDYLTQDWLQTAVPELEVTEHHRNDLAQLLKAGKVWLLLDGADEMTVADSLQHIAAQMRGMWLQNARVVLTCRLNVWEAGKNALDNFDVYHNLDFEYPDKVHQFIDKCFQDEPDFQQTLKAALEQPGKERIRDMVKNPLRLTLLCYSWQIRQGELPETKAGLYEWFVDAFYEWNKGKVPYKLTSAKRKELNQALGELAREAIDQDSSRFRLTEKFIIRFLGDVDDEDSLFHLALQLSWLNRIGVAVENPFEGVYAFLHPTFQEYFAALAIDDWHFFLKHIPEDHLSSEANYRIFEQSWRETYLLWLGSDHSTDSQKEELLSALMDLEEVLDKPNFYGIRAKFIVAYSLVEFRRLSRRQEILNWLLNLSISQIRTFSDPVASAARNLLREIPGTVLADPIAECLRVEDTHLKHDAAKLVGELKCSEPQVIGALTELALNTEFKDIRCDALCSLLKIDSTNKIAIDGLIQTLDGKGADAFLGISAAQALGCAEINQEKIIKALETYIQPQLLEQESLSLPPYHELACAAALSLLKLDSENQKSITALRLLFQNYLTQIRKDKILTTLNKLGINIEGMETSDEREIQNVFQEDLKDRLSDLGLSIELGPLTTIKNLVGIIIANQELKVKKSAAWCLELVFHDFLPSLSVDIYPELVSLLKGCIESLPTEKSKKRTVISFGTKEPIVVCYMGLWNMSEYMSLKEFYKAWNA
jgi:energy-coupling factor transporter ATP-binding protein EcfA2